LLRIMCSITLQWSEVGEYQYHMFWKMNGTLWDQGIVTECCWVLETTRQKGEMGDKRSKSKLCLFALFGWRWCKENLVLVLNKALTHNIFIMQVYVGLCKTLELTHCCVVTYRYNYEIDKFTYHKIILSRIIWGRLKARPFKTKTSPIYVHFLCLHAAQNKL